MLILDSFYQTDIYRSGSEKLSVWQTADSDGNEEFTVEFWLPIPKKDPRGDPHKLLRRGAFLPHPRSPWG
jgi:hypothetical protein